MPVTTYTQYLKAKSALAAANDEALDGIEAQRRRCYEPADAQLDATLDAIRDALNAGLQPPSNARLAAAHVQAEAARDLRDRKKADCDKAAADQKQVVMNRYRAQLDQLEQEAKDGLAKVQRVIITLGDLRPAAEALQTTSWYDNQTPAPSALMFVVNSLSDLRREFKRDRFTFELLLMVRAENGKLVFGNDRRTISQIVADVGNARKLVVQETFNVRGELIGAPPNDTDSLRIFGTWSVISLWVPPLVLLPAIDHIFLMLDDFSAPLDWNKHVIGLHDNAQRINIQIEGHPTPGKDLPSRLTVVLKTRVPNHENGASSVTSPQRFHVAKNNPASGPNRTVYRLTRRIHQFAPPDPTSIREVATIARPGGTSADIFRNALGWAPRGIATLPGSPAGVSGDATAEVPDARLLLQAGGLEVLDVELIDLPAHIGVRESKHSRLIRSPADIMYVSGHGILKHNCIALDRNTCWSRAEEQGNKPPPDMSKWITPTTRLAVGDLGNLQGDEPTVFIFAGCSLLTISTRGRLSGNGLAWARLLHTQQGTLRAILGYRKGINPGFWTSREASAPSDAAGGNDIAREMASRIAAADGRLDYVQTWLEVNEDHDALMATGIDAAGYWWMEKSLGGLNYTVEGPRRLPTGI